jgi:hypothetical protein
VFFLVLLPVTYELGMTTVYTASGQVYGRNETVILFAMNEWKEPATCNFVIAFIILPHAYVNHRLQIQLELLMMSGMPLETC